MTHAPRTILLAGPTASGKSALALALAERLGGAVVNADALQVYADWRVLTARPGAEDEARAPHLLYGGEDAARADYSVGRWLEQAAEALEDCARRGLRPIVAGGTGLYFTALTEGLAPIPPTPPEIRAALLSRLEASGLAALAAELEARDPATAARLDRGNPRRVLRALEALETTGEGLAAWAARTPPPLLPLERTVALRLETPPEALGARIEARLRAMAEQGALEEVRAVLERGLSWDLPAMKALGAREFAAHLAGDITLDQAISAAAAATRRYAKRQRTWLRNRMAGWCAASAAQAEGLIRDIADDTRIIP